MTGRSGRGRWERVLAARRQARMALGQDSNTADLFDAPPKRATNEVPPMPHWNTARPPERPDESVGVLMISEAATRLGISRAALESMIERGEVQTLPTMFIPVIPTREVQRLRPPGSVRCLKE